MKTKQKMVNFGLPVLLLVASVFVVAYGQRSNLVQINCNCTSISDPVCGSGEIPFRNQCEACCAFTKKEIKGISYFGKCDGRKRTDCSCKNELKPVCGSNGIDYRNDCLRKCEARKNPCLSATQGVCPTIIGDDIEEEELDDEEEVVEEEEEGEEDDEDYKY